MSSTVDATKPTAGTATTASVRTNFTAIETEINELHRMTEDFVTTGGSADSYTANFSEDVVLADGVRVTVEIHATNTTTTPSIDVDSGGAVTIVRPDGTACVASDLLASGRYDLMYDGTNWRVLNPSSIPSVTSTLMQSIYPVGHIYIGTTSTNPDTLLFGGAGDTTWAAFGEGRVLVGYNDATNGTTITAASITSNVMTVTVGASHDFAAGQEVTIANLTYATTDPNGDYTITSVTSTEILMALVGADETFGTGSSPTASLFSTNGQTQGTQSHQLIEDEMPAHTHLQEGGYGGAGSGYQADASGSIFPSEATSSTGGDLNHNNIQPSVVVYMWKRTA